MENKIKNADAQVVQKPEDLNTVLRKDTEAKGDIKKPDKLNIRFVSVWDDTRQKTASRSDHGLHSK